jgi:hypothetical protein
MCSVEIAVEQSGFRFAEGPLVPAPRHGSLIVADEGYFLIPSALIALIPICEGQTGDKFLQRDGQRNICIGPGVCIIIVWQIGSGKSCRQTRNDAIWSIGLNSFDICSDELMILLAISDKYEVLNLWVIAQ